VRANRVDVPLLPAKRSAAAGPVPARSRRRMVAGSIAAASLLAAALGVVSVVSDDDEENAVGTAPASTSLVAPGPSPTSTAAAPPTDLSWPPRLLLGDGWDVISVNEKSTNEGFMSFQRADQIVFVGWYRGDSFVHDDAWYQEHGYTETGSGTLLGASVPIYSPQLAYEVGDIRELLDSGQLQSELLDGETSSADHADTDLIGGEFVEAELREAIADGLIEGVVTQGPEAALVQDASSVTVQAWANDEHVTLSIEDFRSVLATVRQVDAAAWEAALPDDVVTPAERQAVIDEMLSGMPQPDGFDFAATGGQPLVQDRAYLVNDIVQSVACAWVNTYFTAESGSPEAAAAVDAIASIPEWSAAQELAQVFDSDVEGMIPPSNNGALDLGVDAEGMITYDGEVLDGYFAANLCDPNAVG
jgi:hypothetical protein